MTTGEHVRKLRRLKSLRQEDMADRLGLKRGTYAAKEAKGNFTIQELTIIAEVLGVPLEELTNGKEVRILDSKQLEILISNQVEIIACLRVLLAGIADLQSRASEIPEKSILTLQQKMVHREAAAIWDEIQGK